MEKINRRSLCSDREALGFLMQLIRCSPQSSQDDCSHLGKAEGRTPWNLVPLPLHTVKQKKKKGLLGLTMESQVPLLKRGLEDCDSRKAAGVFWGGPRCNAGGTCAPVFPIFQVLNLFKMVMSPCTLGLFSVINAFSWLD